MGIITEKVEITVNGRNIGYYQNLGYYIPTRINEKGNSCYFIGSKIEVNIKDVAKNSHVKIDLKCDNCGKETKCTIQTYHEIVKENGNTYCKSCATKLYTSESARLTKLSKSKSFYDWCLENDGQYVLDIWDYELNKYSPKEVSYSTEYKAYFKCPRGLHESQEKRIKKFIKKGEDEHRCICTKCNSIAQWGIDNLGDDFLEKYWDYKLNKTNPWYINYGNSSDEIWIKCQNKDYHESYSTTPNSFTNTNNRCPYCSSKRIHPKDSFAQYHIDNTDKDFLEKYWSNKNKINPWEIAYTSEIYIWIKCQNKEYHEDYNIKCSKFSMNRRCPYCASRKVHLKDSLGQYIIDNFGEDYLNKIWSDKNEKSPFTYFPQSHCKVWWKCHESNHEDYERTIDLSNRLDFRCPQEYNYRGEILINEWLVQNNIDFSTQKKFSDLFGVGGGLLSYDFYVPDYNLLIEYQGEFHDGNTNIAKEKYLYRQQEHDRRKAQYCKDNNINLLEIWYYDYDNISQILSDYLKINYQ